VVLLSALGRGTPMGNSGYWSVIGQNGISRPTVKRVDDAETWFLAVVLTRVERQGVVV
jgi:hypothetical protein